MPCSNWGPVAIGVLREGSRSTSMTNFRTMLRSSTIRIYSVPKSNHMRNTKSNQQTSDKNSRYASTNKASGQNLTFAEYKMPARRNKQEAYDANVKGPSTKKRGVLKIGLLELDEPFAEEVQVAQTTQWSWSLMALWMLVFACCLRRG